MTNLGRAELANRGRRHRGDGSLDLLQARGRQGGAAGGADLEAVVAGRIVAGGDHHGARRADTGDAERGDGRGARTVDEKGRDAGGGQDLGCRAGELGRSEPAVVADDDAVFPRPLAAHEVGEPLGHAPHVGKRVFVRNARAPAVRPEPDGLAGHEAQRSAAASRESGAPGDMALRRRSERVTRDAHALR